MNTNKITLNHLTNEIPYNLNIEKNNKTPNPEDNPKTHNSKKSEILCLFQRSKFLTGKIIRHLSIKEQVNFLKSSWVANILFKKLNGNQAPLTIEQTKELFGNVSFNESSSDRSHWYNRVVDIEPLFIKYYKNWTSNNNIPFILKEFHYLKSCQFKRFKLGERGGDALTVFFQHIPLELVFTEKNIDLVFEKDDFFDIPNVQWSKFFNLFPNTKKIHFIKTNFEKERQELNLLKHWNLISDDLLHLCTDYTLDSTLPVKESNLSDKTSRKKKIKKKKNIHPLASLKLNKEDSIKEIILAYQNKSTKESSRFLSLLTHYERNIQTLTTVLNSRTYDPLNGCEIAHYFEFIKRNFTLVRKFICFSEIERAKLNQINTFLPSWNTIKNPELLTYSASAEFPPALYLFAMLKVKMTKTHLLEDLDMKKAAKKGYAPALAFLGHLTLLKFLKTKDPSDSLSMREFIQAAAAQKNPHGLYLESICHLYGYGIEQNIALGLHLLSKAAFEYSSEEAIFEYATLHSIGYLLPENKPYAEKMLNKFHDRRGVDIVLMRICHYLNEQKNKGDAEAFYLLSQAFLDGWGKCPVNHQEWERLLLEAVKLNHPKAIYQYGSFLCQGHLVKQDVEKGRELLRRLPNGEEIIQTLNKRSREETTAFVPEKK